MLSKKIDVSIDFLKISTKSTQRIVHNCEKQKIDPLQLSECLIFSYIFDAWQPSMENS